MLSILLNLLGVASMYYICSYNHTDWYGEYPILPIHWNRVVGLSKNDSILTSLCKGPIYMIPPYIVVIQSVCIKNPVTVLQSKPDSFKKISHNINHFESFYKNKKSTGIYQSMVHEPIQHMYTICFYTSYDYIYS